MDRHNDGYYHHKARCMLIDLGRRRCAEQARAHQEQKHIFTRLLEMLLRLHSIEQEHVLDSSTSTPAPCLRSSSPPPPSSSSSSSLPANQLMKETVEWILHQLSQTEHCHCSTRSTKTHQQGIGRYNGSPSGNKRRRDDENVKEEHISLNAPRGDVFLSELIRLYRNSGIADADRTHVDGDVEAKGSELSNLSLSFNAVVSFYHVMQASFLDFVTVCVNATVRDPKLIRRDAISLRDPEMQRVISLKNLSNSTGQQSVTMLHVMCLDSPLLLLTLRMLSILAARCDHVACLDLASSIVVFYGNTKGDRAMCDIIRAMSLKSDAADTKLRDRLEQIVFLLLSDINDDNNVIRVSDWIRSNGDNYSCNNHSYHKNNRIVTDLLSHADTRQLLSILGWRWIPQLCSRVTTLEYQCAKDERSKFINAVTFVIRTLGRDELTQNVISYFDIVTKELGGSDITINTMHSTQFAKLISRLLQRPSDSEVVASQEKTHTHHASYIQAIRNYIVLTLVCQRCDNGSKAENMSETLHAFLGKGVDSSLSDDVFYSMEHSYIQLLFIFLERINSEASRTVSETWIETLGANTKV